MIRFKIRTATIGALALAGIVGVHIPGAGRRPLKLESIDVQTVGPAGAAQAALSGPAPEPLPFTIDKPARIAFDLPNTTLALASRRIDVRSGGVDTVLAAEANGRTRLVVNVDRSCPTRPRSTATHPRHARRQPATRPAATPRRARARAQAAAAVERSSRRSIFGAAPTAPAA
jgi:hypothetical protein